MKYKLKINVLYAFVIIFSIIILLSVIYGLYIYNKYCIEKFQDENNIIKRDEFDCYIINLQRNKERLDNITKLYKNSDLYQPDFIRIEAVDGNKIDTKLYVTDEIYNGIVEIDKTGIRKNSKQLTKGMIGCYLSHLEIYNQFINSNKQYAFVLEDDASFNNDIYNIGIKNVLKDVPNDWDIILLGRIGFNEINKDTYVQMSEFWGTWGYIINQKGAQTMITYGNIPITIQIDAKMIALAKEGKLKIYGTLINYISAGHFGSEIQMPHEEKVD